MRDNRIELMIQQKCTHPSHIRTHIHLHKRTNTRIPATHTCTHSHPHPCTHTHTHAFTPTPMHSHPTPQHTHTHTHTHTYTHTHTHTHRSSLRFSHTLTTRMLHLPPSRRCPKLVPPFVSGSEPCTSTTLWPSPSLQRGYVHMTLVMVFCA